MDAHEKAKVWYESLAGGPFSRCEDSASAQMVDGGEDQKTPAETNQDVPIPRSSNVPSESSRSSSSPSCCVDFWEWTAVALLGGEVKEERTSCIAAAGSASRGVSHADFCLGCRSQTVPIPYLTLDPLLQYALTPKVPVVSRASNLLDQQHKHHSQLHYDTLSAYYRPRPNPHHLPTSIAENPPGGSLLLPSGPTSFHLENSR